MKFFITRSEDCERDLVEGAVKGFQQLIFLHYVCTYLFHVRAYVIVHQCMCIYVFGVKGWKS